MVDEAPAYRCFSRFCGGDGILEYTVRFVRAVGDIFLCHRFWFCDDTNLKAQIGIGFEGNAFDARDIEML